MTAADQPSLHWEHDWDAAMTRASRERRLLLIDVEKDN